MKSRVNPERITPEALKKEAAKRKLEYISPLTLAVPEFDACRGKNKYDSRDEVLDLIALIKHESFGGAMDLKPYKCKYCNKWHLTKFD
jgi:hypothetical protein